MKSGVAAWVAAAIDFVRETPPSGSLVVTITGDEEGDGVDGTAAILDWMAENGERMDHCLVGEPTCPERMGDTMKIGRRGSLTAHLTAYGKQGHTAYPDRAKNPLPGLVRLLDRLAARTLDDGHRALRPLDARDHHDRRRQPRLERHPGRGAGHGQRPLQRRPLRREPLGLDRGGGRPRRRRSSASASAPASRSRARAS